MATEIHASTILSKLRGGPDEWFGISYSMNIYRGCSHACIYCDTRSLCYQIGSLSDIRVKTNAPQLLMKELKGKKKKGTIGTGSMNDPYMPVESELKVVRQCLKIIAAFRFPVHVMTKSDLVLRDADVLKDISRTYLAVSFTITDSRDHVSRILEPGAPPASKRFAALAELAQSGLYCGISMMPVLPFISDTEENVQEMFRMASDSGVSYIMPWFGLTQREGQREYFYSKLEQDFPGMKQQYEKTFGGKYGCDSPRGKKLYDLCCNLSEKFNIPLKMKHFETSGGGVQTTLF
jgi:DNA repair photolyase